MSKCGLKINDKIIKKISGPVSFTILKPNIVTYKYLYNHLYNQKEYGGETIIRKTKLPLIILFGDEHFSFKHRCEPCENEDGCFNIYDDSFLSQLNSISNDENPVEFYTETFNINKSNKHFKYEMQGFMDVLHEEIKNCFDKKDKEKCIYPNIKWQYGDLRNQNEEYVNENILFVNDTEADKQIGDGSSFLECLLPVMILFFEDKKKIKIDTEKLLFTLKYFKWDEILTFKQIGTRTNMTFVQIFTENFFRVILEESTNKTSSGKYKSRLAKQLEKQTLDKYVWMQIFKENLDFILKGYLNFDDKFKTYYKTTIENFFKEGTQPNEDDVELFKNFIMFFKQISSIFLDFYFITRIMKKPADGNNCSVAIGYFGSFHTENITKILTSSSISEQPMFGFVAQNIPPLYHHNTHIYYPHHVYRPIINLESGRRCIDFEKKMYILILMKKLKFIIY